MLQRLDPPEDYGLFDQLAASHEAGLGALVALVTQSDGDLSTGAWALVDSVSASAGSRELVALLQEVVQDWPEWRFKPFRTGTDSRCEVFVIQVPAPTRVLLCGAGPDAVPMARALAELDWEVVVTDHRPAFARPDRFPSGCTVIQARPERLAERLDLGGLDAAVIMSHHLENDAAYLEQLARRDIPYIGVLGPRARRERLMELANCRGRTVFGPVGLDIGAELPSAIALSTAAEIHAVLNGRTGNTLTVHNDE